MARSFPARALELYGDAVDDVRLLRRRGFVVVRRSITRVRPYRMTSPRGRRTPS